MSGTALNFNVKLSADDPKAEPYSQEVLVSPGVIALWELQGPGDKSDRTIDTLSDRNSMVDISWLIWAALGRPNGEFTEFLPRLLDIEAVDIEVKPNPKAPSTK